MAIALGTDVSGQGASVTSLTLASVVVSGSDRVLFVAAGGSDGGGAPTISNVTWNGSNSGLTTVWDSASGNFSSRARHFVAPTETTANVVVTFGAEASEVEAGAVPMTGVNQSSPIGTAVTANSASGQPSVTVTTAAGQVVLDHAYGDGTAITVGANQTSVFEQENIGAFGSGGTSQQAGADGGVMTWTGMSADWVTGAVPYKPTAATAALTGTITSSTTESDIVSGGKTIILTLTDDTWVSGTPVTPVIEAADCTVSGSNTAADPWTTVAYPNASAGDLLIFCIAWDDSTTTTDVVEPAGPNSEVLTEIVATPVTDSGTETRSKAWYTVATGSWTAGNLSFNPSATESWSATCIRVPAGEFDASTPIGAIGTSSDSGGGTDTTVDSPAFTAGASDGDGRLVWFAGVDADPLSATNPTGWTILQRQDLGAVAHGIATRDAAVTDSESIASATWSIAGDSWTSIAFVVRAPTTSPFEDVRDEIRDGVDSAQSEGTGWDALKSTTMPVANVVRTSNTVCTITLAAAASYNITAQETITATVPAAALSLASALVASPTFTIDTSGGGGAVLKDIIGGFIPWPR